MRMQVLRMRPVPHAPPHTQCTAALAAEWEAEKASRAEQLQPQSQPQPQPQPQPALSYIFVGDVGELDRQAGELMLIQYTHENPA